MIIFKAEVEAMKQRALQKKINDQMDVLRRSGLDKEAKRLLPQYNATVERLAELDKEREAQRRVSSCALLVCLICADLATVAADQFGEVIDEVNVGMKKEDNEFIRLMKFNAEKCALEWNRIVQLIDEGAHDIKASTYYAEFAEDITNELLPYLTKRVAEMMKTKEGQKRF